MIALLTSLFRAIAAYLELKLLRGKWELVRDIERHHHDTEMEIERLRATGLTANHLRADRLRDSLLRMQSIAASITANLPTGGANPAGGQASRDSGRDVHAADNGSMAQRGEV